MRTERKKERPMAVKKYSERRRLRVAQAIRRYDRVVYNCGAVYTVLEDAGDGLRKYPAETILDLKLSIPTIGYYESATGELFASHELDEMVKGKILEELEAEQSPQQSAATTASPSPPA